jgi:hypothetical protein
MDVPPESEFVVARFSRQECAGNEAHVGCFGFWGNKKGAGFWACAFEISYLLSG